MSLSRSLLLRRIVAAAFLLMGLSTQSQEVFACPFMEGKPQFLCCCGQMATEGCEMNSECSHLKNHAATDCCQVNITKLAGFHTPSSPLSQLLTILLDGPQPPPAILPSITPAVAHSRPLPTVYPIPAWPPGFPGTRTYLLTQRWRN